MQEKENTRFLNKKVKIVFYDSKNHVSTKKGKLLEINQDSITIYIYELENPVIIFKQNIIRIELMNENGR